MKNPNNLPENMFAKDFATEDITNTVFSTTNEMLLAFPRDFINRCKPFPIRVFHFVDASDFNSEVRKDIVLNDLQIEREDDLNHQNWIGCAWTRGNMSRWNSTNRTFQRHNANLMSMRRGLVQMQLYSEAEIEVKVSMFSSSPEWLQCIQEILAVTSVDTGFDFVYNAQTYRASYVPQFGMSDIIFVDRQRYGNLCMLNVSLKINYPLALNIDRGSIVKTVNVEVNPVTNKQMEELKGKHEEVIEEKDGNGIIYIKVNGED